MMAGEDPYDLGNLQMRFRVFEARQFDDDDDVSPQCPGSFDCFRARFFEKDYLNVVAHPPNPK